MSSGQKNDSDSSEHLVLRSQTLHVLYEQCTRILLLPILFLFCLLKNDIV